MLKNYLILFEHFTQISPWWWLNFFVLYFSFQDFVLERLLLFSCFSFSCFFVPIFCVFFFVFDLAIRVTLWLFDLKGTKFFSCQNLAVGYVSFLLCRFALFLFEVSLQQLHAFAIFRAEILFNALRSQKIKLIGVLIKLKICQISCIKIGTLSALPNLYKLLSSDNSMLVPKFEFMKFTIFNQRIMETSKQQACFYGTQFSHNPLYYKTMSNISGDIATHCPDRIVQFLL